MAANSHLAAKFINIMIGFENFDTLPLVQEARDLHLVRARLSCPGTSKDNSKKIQGDEIFEAVNLGRKTGQYFQRCRS